MQPRSNIIHLERWTYNPWLRQYRWRCQGCARLIEDGADVVVERRRPGRSHGYHKACFETTEAGRAALARDQERLNPKP